jgi:predicted AlkP superfamily pyrophosphatase or phosphodiesterase
MVQNAWYDRAAGKQVACADDDAATIVSYGQPLTGPGESARALRTSTLADELRAQRNDHARVIAFSLKARSAVTLAGQRADAAAWFDDRGGWVTSSAYTSAPVPAVADFVRAHPVEADFGKTWDRTLAKAVYLFEAPAIGVTPKIGMTNDFPHIVKGPNAGPDATFYSQWQSSPFADEYLAHMAASVAGTLGLGTAARTDFIGISFSTLDKVGHDFGPNSHEIQDVLVRLDRTLGEFFDGLDRTVGRGNYTVALTADHGVAPMPERAKTQGLDAGRVSADYIRAGIEDTLAVLSPAPVKHVKEFVNTDAYLTPGTWEVLRLRPALIAKLRADLGKIPGVLGLYTRDELDAGRFESDVTGQRLARSYMPGRSGDLVVVLKPYWITSATGTTHGSSYGYDTRVPIFFMGKGITHGEYLEPVSPTDIAPTLAFLAGITLPRAQGHVLTAAITPEARVK